MLDVICSELAVDLREAFPGLIVGPYRLMSDYYIVAKFDCENRTAAVIWVSSDGVITRLSTEAITATLWVKAQSAGKIVCHYSDPETFDRIQTFVAEHYEAYLLDRGALKC